MVDCMTEAFVSYEMVYKESIICNVTPRTMQTAVGAFGGPQFSEDDPSPPLMVKDGGGSEHPAISSSGCPPFMAVELCREHMVRFIFLFTHNNPQILPPLLQSMY